MSDFQLLGKLVTVETDPGKIKGEEWPGLIEVAIRQGLGPMLYWIVKGSNIATEDKNIFEPLAASGREAGIHYALLNQYQSKVDHDLREADIPTLWLKGIALVHTVYPQPWTRPMVDLDLLVPYHQREAALAIIEKLGFHQPREPEHVQFDLPEELQHHFHLMGGVADAVCVELHFRLLGVDGQVLLPTDELVWFWGNTEEVTEDWGRMMVLKPEAHLLYLCAHAMLQHGEANLRLLQILDLHLLVTKNKPDWEMVVDKAIELKWSYAIKRALELTINNFTTQVPSWVLDELNNRRSFDEDISRANRLADQGSRWESEMLLLSKLPYLTRLQIVSSLLFPPRDFIRQRYAIANNQPVLPYYIYRWYDSGREVIMAIRNRYIKGTQNGT